jgi:hypothetical protein
MLGDENGAYTMNGENNKLPLWALAALSWLVSLYFLVGFAINVGFPPGRSLTSADLAYGFLWLLFLFLPFFNKVKIGRFLELERELKNTKEELKDFKTEIRNNISVLSTNINTIGSFSNQVTVNLPGLAELEELKRKIDELTTPTTKQEAEEIRSDILLESEHTLMALARIRIKMEYLLRKILGKKLSVNELRNMSIKFLGLRSMFNMFINENPQYRYLLEPFMYVNQVCNAAIHAQRVPEEQASEALDLGATILAVLTDVANSREN